jgi:spermidine synthase
VNAWTVYALTLVLAFCSIVYELLLGQTLAAFLGNTVLRYSVTIGLYMLAMGMGAMAAQGRVLTRPAKSLQVIELLLTLLGGFSVLLLFLLESVGGTGFVFVVTAHGLIVAIGVLSGLEIPVLIELRARRDPDATSGVLGVDYAGAFLGTIAFAFVCYPRLGLLPTAMGVAALNAAVGVAIGVARVRQGGGGKALLVPQAALLVVLLGGLAWSEAVNEAALSLYLRAGAQ